jgi:protein O-GlcNAc transferase
MNIALQLQQVEKTLAQGDARSALAQLEVVLATEPSAEAWNLKARALITLGQRAEARRCLVNCVELDRTFDRGWANLAKLEADEGQVVQALEFLERGLASSPTSVRLLRASATAYRIQGRLDKALHTVESLISLTPTDALQRERLSLLLGVGDRVRGFALACELFLDGPFDQELLALIVDTQSSAGDPSALVPVLRKAVEEATSADQCLFVGAQCAQIGNWPLALQTAERALELDPASASAAVCLAEAHEALAQPGAAIKVLESWASRSSSPDAYLKLARLYRYGEQPEAAAEALMAARRRFPQSAAVLVTYAEDVRNRGEFQLALETLQEAVHIAPKDADVHAALGRDLLSFRESTGLRHLHRATQLNPDSRAYRARYLFELHNTTRPADALAREHLRFGAQFGLARPVAANSPMLSPERKLRLGYLSADFRNHSVAFFILPILRNHNREQFDVTLYADHAQEDSLSEQFRLLGHSYRHVRHQSNQVVAETIAADGIDILIDLSGMTNVDRVGVFARRPAPVQVTYLGYPDTTGLDCVDYRITDALADPVGSEAFYSETLLRLPETAWCYEPGFDVPLAVREDQRITFGCFNTLGKVTDEMVQLWAEICNRVPHSRLLLKSRLFGDPKAKEHLTKRLCENGLKADRLELVSWTLSREVHLEFHREIDIALDPSPYNGTTTTCDALWMGVPVVTLAGQVHASRVGISLLESVGLSDLVTYNPRDYLERAVELARDATRRRLLRTELRNRLQNSSLGDPLRFVPAFEAQLRVAWQTYVDRRTSGELPPAGRRLYAPSNELRAVGPVDPFTYHSRTLLTPTLSERDEVELLGNLARIFGSLHDSRCDAGHAICAFARAGGTVTSVQVTREMAQQVTDTARANQVASRVVVSARSPLAVVPDASVVRIGADAAAVASIVPFARDGRVLIWRPVGAWQAVAGSLAEEGLIALKYRPGLRQLSRLTPEDVADDSLVVIVSAATHRQLELGGLTRDAAETATADANRAAQVAAPGRAGPFSRVRALSTLARYEDAFRLLAAMLPEVHRFPAWQSDFQPPLPAQDGCASLSCDCATELLALEAIAKLPPHALATSPIVVNALHRYQSLGGPDLEMAHRYALQQGPTD